MSGRKQACLVWTGAAHAAWPAHSGLWLCHAPPILCCRYVYINGALVGGCDATKALIASGEFDKMVGGEWRCGTGQLPGAALLYRGASGDAGQLANVCVHALLGFAICT